MFIIHKVLVTSDRGTTKRTPKAALYKDLSDFIHGRLARLHKKQTPVQFVEAVEQLKADKKKLYVAAYIKDGTYFNYLTISEDNNIINISTRTKLGSTIEKAVSYLSNPLHQAELDSLKEMIEKKWAT